MLVLTRQRDEAIEITTPDGVLIVVSVVDIRGDKIRLGISAPRSTSIDREEVAQAKRRAEKVRMVPVIGAAK